MALYQQGPRIVEAEQCTDEERVVHTADGYKVAYQGDWIITDAAQRQDIIADNFFRASFQQVKEEDPVEEAPVSLPVPVVVEETPSLAEVVLSEPATEEASLPAPKKSGKLPPVEQPEPVVEQSVEEQPASDNPVQGV